MGTDQHLERLQKLRGSSVLIVGIGNSLKGDDGVGPAVCERLKNSEISAEVIDTATAPENYIQKIISKAPQNLLVIDAVDFSAQAGQIKIFEPEQLSSHILSTHTLSPRIFIEMISKSIKTYVYFIGIQPARTEFGKPLSEQVEKAAEQLCQVLTEIFPPK
jgi:hydrogenase 3 maturation protease